MALGQVCGLVLIFAPFLVARRCLGRAGCVDPELRLRVLAMAAAAVVSIAGALLASASVQGHGPRAWWWSTSDLVTVGTATVVASAALGLLSGWLERQRHAEAAWLVALPLLLAVPHVGPRSALVEASRFRAPTWRDGVCLQSTYFTCTAAAGATLLRAVGIDAGESEMAARCATERGGTRLAGLARGLATRLAAAKRTARACRFDPAKIDQAPLPLVAFAPGHAFVVFAVPSAWTLEIGDPVAGRLTVARSDFEARALGVGVVLAPVTLRELDPPPWGLRLGDDEPGATLRFGAVDAAPWPILR